MLNLGVNISLAVTRGKMPSIQGGKNWVGGALSSPPSAPALPFRVSMAVHAVKLAQNKIMYFGFSKVTQSWIRSESRVLEFNFSSYR